MGVEHKIKITENEDGTQLISVVIFYRHEGFTSMVLLNNHSDVYIWDDLIKAIKTNDTFHMREGDSNFSIVGIKDGFFAVVSEVSEDGDNIVTLFKLPANDFLPFAEKIRNELYEIHNPRINTEL